MVRRYLTSFEYSMRFEFASERDVDNIWRILGLCTPPRHREDRYRVAFPFPSGLSRTTRSTSQKLVVPSRPVHLHALPAHLHRWNNVRPRSFPVESSHHSSAPSTTDECMLHREIIEKSSWASGLKKPLKFEISRH